MNKNDIAAQLAAITGRPIEEFLDGSESEESNGDLREESVSADTKDTNSRELRVLRSTETHNQRQYVVKSNEVRIEERFGGVIPKDKVIGGRQMTRKEYLEEIKGKTQSQILNSVYLYKMFRAEGQKEANFIEWIYDFPEDKND